MQTRRVGIVISYIKVAVNMVCGIVMSSVLLRMLGDTEYGIYQTVAAFANNLVLLEFGVGTVLIRNVSICLGRKAGKDEIQNHISTIWTLTCLLSLALAAVSVLFYYLIPEIYSKSMDPAQIRHGQNMFIFIGVHLFLNFLMHTVNAVIFAFEDYSYGSLQSVFRTIVRTVLLVVLTNWIKNAAVIALVDMTLGVVCFLVSWNYCREKLKIKLRFGKCDPAILRASLPLALAVFLQGIVNQANSNVDKVLIGVFLSPESVALYSVSLYIYSIFSTLVNVSASMYVPTITQKVGQGKESGELVKDLVVPGRLTALLGGLVLFGFAALGRQFVEILYGSDYLTAWPIAIVLMAPAYIDAVAGAVVYVLDALNRRMIRSLVLIATTAMNIVLTIYCLNRWGIFGAAAATALCTFIGPVLFMDLYYKKVLKIPMLRLFRQAFRGILPYLVLGCLAALAVSGMIGNVWASFLVGGIVFAGAALGGYLLFGMNEEEKELMKKLLGKKR